MKASKQISESLPIMILLTLSGGFMDAYSYLCRGEVFANAQTGNILLFGVNLSMGHWSKALQYVCPVLAFAIGIAAAEFVRRKFTNRKHVHWRQIIVFCEAVILFGVMFIPQELNLLANSLTSLACGAQAVSYTHLSSHALDVFEKYKIKTYYGNLVEYIINRDKTGMCPMEKAVLEVDEPNTAYDVLKKKIAEMRKGGH